MLSQSDGAPESGSWAATSSIRPSSNAAQHTIGAFRSARHERSAGAPPEVAKREAQMEAEELRRQAKMREKRRAVFWQFVLEQAVKLEEKMREKNEEGL